MAFPLSCFLVVLSAAALLTGGAGATAGACDTDGVTVTYATRWDPADARYEVSAARVGDIADACTGRELRVMLARAEGKQRISTGRGRFLLVQLPDPPAAEDVERVDVLILG